MYERSLGICRNWKITNNFRPSSYCLFRSIIYANIDVCYIIFYKTLHAACVNTFDIIPR
uniref:Uncharacterized protein n=1 Tax=virus sp. ctQ5V6 TaxID=2825815 RepID=A0A8S5RPY8_9VIRU|nr:MAG TPA: hypothetical protein [virus sp. ctQ5V6]